MLLLNLDRSCGQPIYLQIVNQVQRLIDDQALPEGYSLPATRALAERLGVNRSTVYRAYQELWAHGYLDSRPGSYTRVRQRPQLAGAGGPEPGMLPWGEVAAASGQRLYQRFLSYTPEWAVREPASDLVNLSRLDLDPRLFPVDEIRRSCNQALGYDGWRALMYGSPQGDPDLRSFIAERARTHGMEVTPEEVLITNGSQQAIDLVLRVLTEPDQTVALEEPTYANVIPLVRYHQLQVAGVPMNQEGLDLQQLEKVINEQRPALLYTIPNFQNPTGITTTQIHRETLLALCERYRLPLVEDGFEEEMKYFGRVALPIKSMDKNKVVVYLGTFSKVLFPGLRIGFVIADAELISRLTAVKRFTDLSASTMVQVALNHFCRSGCYERHIRKMHRVFRKRMQVALDSARTHLPSRLASWTEPSGGYLIWVTLKEQAGNEQRFAEVCQRHGVSVSPGSYYFASATPQVHFRISISTLDEDQIREGFARLGRALLAYTEGVDDAARAQA
jgi:DNA-binding transcriptional MocR family regulator